MAYRALCAAFLFVASAHVGADVRMPNGEWQERRVDMTVKVMGGDVEVRHAWQLRDINLGDWRWHLNPSWGNLEFVSATDENGQSSLRAIVRADGEFERRGDDVFVYMDDYSIVRSQTGWRWKDRSGDWMDYDVDGKATGYGSLGLTTARFVRDGQGRLWKVTDRNGKHVLEIEYDGTSARFVRVTDHTQRTVQYRWRPEGSSGIQRIHEIVDVRGKIWSYEYDSSGERMTAIIDPLQGETSIAYVGNRVLRVLDAEQNRRQSSLGTTYDYEYNKVQRVYSVTKRTPGGVEHERTYDQHGRLLSYDIDGRQVRKFVRDGLHARHMTDAEQQRSSIEFDAEHRPILYRNVDGSERTVAYDPRWGLPVEKVDEAGVRSTYQYDDLGNLVRAVEAAGTSTQRTTELTYFGSDVANGIYLGMLRTRAVKNAGPAGEDSVTEWTYTDRGYVASVKNPVGAITQFQGHDALGFAWTVIDAMEEEWKATYDPSGRLLSTTDPLLRTTSRRYDDSGNLIATVDTYGKETAIEVDALGQMLSSTDPGGGVERAVHDADRNRVEIEDAAGLSTRLDYNAAGQLESIEDSAGNVTQLVYEGLQLRSMNYPTYRETFTYDRRGFRTRSVKTPKDGSAGQMSTAWKYDARGLLIESTDGAGRATRYAYDALRRLVREALPDGGEQIYSYNALDNIVSLRVASGGIYRYDYDLRGRKVRETRPLGEVIDFKYNKIDRLVELAGMAGIRRVSEFDAAGKTIKQMYFQPAATVPARTIVYNYDRGGRLASYAQIGENPMSARFEYDWSGRTIAESTTLGESAQQVTFNTAVGYDAAGRKTSYTYPDGFVSTFQYDPMGRLSGATAPGGGAVEYSQFEWNRATQVTLPGAQRRQEFDYLQRPERIVSETASGAGAVVLQDLQYSYDQAGNIATAQSLQGVSTYQYDSMNRLLSADHPATSELPDEHYTYDLLGNRTSSADRAGTWNYNASGQLLSAGEDEDRVQWSYTDAGNRKTSRTAPGGAGQAGTDYAYDTTNRLARIQDAQGGVVATYQYDPRGRRIAKTTAQGTTWFLYSEEGLAAEMDSSGTVVRRYGWLPGNSWGTDPLWMSENVSGETRTSYYHVDARYAPHLLTDSSGDVVWSLVADTFGRGMSETGDATNPLRFPGQYHDVESGHDYNFWRYYDASLGLYLEADPSGLAAGPNLYSYADQNPLTNIDPLGLDAWLVGRGELTLQGGPLGIGVGGGPIFNVHTKELCLMIYICGRAGWGVQASVGMMGGIMNGAHCGKDNDGEQAIELCVEGVAGLGASVCGSLSPSAFIGAEGGVGLSIVVVKCYAAVAGCVNTPCECLDEDDECYCER